MAKSSSKSDKKVEKVAAPKVDKKEKKEKKPSVAEDPVGNGKVSSVGNAGASSTIQSKVILG
jgi:hypothetical protein